MVDLDAVGASQKCYDAILPEWPEWAEHQEANELPALPGCRFRHTFQYVVRVNVVTARCVIIEPWCSGRPLREEYLLEERLARRV